MEKCPICGKQTLIKTPIARVETSGGRHVSDKHSMDCLNKECNYSTGEKEIPVVRNGGCFGILLILFAVILLFGCMGPNHTFKWKLKVTYADGSVDTVTCEHTSVKGQNCAVYLKIQEPGLTSDAGVVPCVVMGYGFYQEVIACGVRKFEILEHSKTLIK